MKFNIKTISASEIISEQNLRSPQVLSFTLKLTFTGLSGRFGQPTRDVFSKAIVHLKTLLTKQHCNGRKRGI